MSLATRASRAVPGGLQLFMRMYTRLGVPGRPPHFEVSFHPYASLTHTIRVRDDVARVRLSDVLRGAPAPVFESIAGILLARLYRRKSPAEMVQTYQQYACSPGARSKLRAVRRIRARRLHGASQGVHHQLDPLFSKLNDEYFGASLPRPRLAWSGREWRRQLGCFDPPLRQIVINRRMDRPEVPRYVVAYVMYHEMLHLKHPARLAHCRLESHSAAFRLEEKKFQDYDRAMKFLRSFR